MDRRTLIFPRSWRWYDVWFPFPLALALLSLPLLDQLDWMMWEETPMAEAELGLWPDRPGRKRRSEVQPDQDAKAGWKPW